MFRVLILLMAVLLMAADECEVEVEEEVGSTVVQSAPTQAPIPKYAPSPTSIPRPTYTPLPTVTPVVTAGTGIARAGIQELFEEAGLLTFRDGGRALDDSNRLVDHWIGESFEPEVRLDLYGPARDLTKLEIGFWTPVDDIEALCVFALLTFVFPNEGDGPTDWLVQNVTSALGGERPSKRYGNVTVTLGRLFQTYLLVTITGS